MAKSKPVDWATIEAEYRAGKLSNRQIAKRFGVTEGAIRKRAKEKNWVRTKGQAAYQPVAEVLAPVRPRASAAASSMKPAPAVDGSDHLTMGRDLALRLLYELDATTSRLDEIEDAIIAETKDDQNGRRRSAMMRAVSLPVRSMTLKTLAQALTAMNEAEGEKGKKEQKVDAAKEAAKGRFATPAAPKLAVDNTKK
ncbi:MAG TPA: hypothetical protein VND94_00935 [Terriglobia bacterium]|nr:hypothetical protein [Terriglobia bacterium]